MASSSIELLDNITKIYSFYFDIFLLTIGLIGNLCLILLFITLRPFRHNQRSFFLTVESIANIGILLSNLPADLYSNVTGIDSMFVSDIWCKLQTSISQIFGLCSLLTICFLTFDQFMSTNPRTNWRQISSLKLAHHLTFFNVCFVLIHSIPFFILTRTDPVDGCMVQHSIFKAYLIYFYYPILSSIMPLIVTITFSLLAYRNVRRIIRRQIPVFRRRLDRQLTAMILGRVFALVLLGLPYIFYSLYRLHTSAKEITQLQIAINNLINTIVFGLLYMNFAISFYLFLLISSRFRRQVKHFFINHCWKPFRCLCRWTICNRIRNRIAPEPPHRIISSNIFS